jgi:hypothetical protein
VLSLFSGRILAVIEAVSLYPVRKNPRHYEFCFAGNVQANKLSGGKPEILWRALKISSPGNTENIRVSEIGFPADIGDGMDPLEHHSHLRIPVPIHAKG